MGHDAKSCVSEVFKMGQKPVWPEHWFLSKWRSKGIPSRLKSKIASGYSFRHFRQLGFSPTYFKLEQIAPNTDSENLITKNNCTQSFEKLPKSLNFAQSVHTGGTHMGEEKPRLSVFRKVIIASVRATACLLSRLFLAGTETTRARTTSRRPSANRHTKVDSGGGGVGAA